MPGLLDVDKARRELEEKDLLTIERETAKTWGARAAASYLGAFEDPDHAEQMRFFWEAETYRAEAIEHAAMTEDARFVERLTVEVEGYRGKARNHLLSAGHAFVEGNRTPKMRRPEPSSRAERLAVRPQAAAAAAAAPAPEATQASAAPPPQARSAPAAPAAPSSVSVPKVQTTPGLGRRPDERSPQ
jgi:hypothetical protein